MNVENIHIQQLKEKDWEQFRNLRIEAVKEHPNYFLDNEEKASAKSSDDWIQLLTDPNAAIFGLFKEKSLIGITGAFRFKLSPEDTIILGMSFIMPNYRGLGLSKLFYKARLDWGKKQKGITRIIVSHREGNNASRYANQKFGFKYYETEEIEFGDQSRGNDIRYELKIERPQNE